MAAPSAWPAAVIFDLDGTLIDSAADLAAVLNPFLTDEGLAPYPVTKVKAFIGDGIRALLAKAFLGRAALPDEARLDALTALFVARYSANPVAATVLFPGALEALAGLKASGVAIGICTNKAERPARLIVEKLGLAGLVDQLVGGDSGFGQKPRPEPLLACAEKLGASKDRVVYVGDLPVDVATARAAGIPIVIVAFGDGHADIGGDRTVKSFADLPAALHDLALSSQDMASSFRGDPQDRTRNP